jgi:hypothetical protein
MRKGGFVRRNRIAFNFVIIRPSAWGEEEDIQYHQAADVTSSARSLKKSSVASAATA